MSTVPRFGVLNAPKDWRTVDFISDLHLMPEEPATHAAWQRYMASTPADAVFILGDLFEAWIGDDAALPGSFEGGCAEVLRQAAARLPVYLMHGNRDFLVGEPFLAAHGVQFLADPSVLDWAGARYLLTHGDLLCTQDVAYQRFRQQVRSPDWQRAVLARPLSERQVMAQQMRAQSVAAQAGGVVYADIDAPLAREWLMAAGAHTLIHGHIHRPGDHALGHDAAGLPWQQVVLSDWHITGQDHRAQVLRLSADHQLERINLGPM